jgi:hypothetical protein
MASYLYRERPRSPSVYRDARFLAECAPQEARNWLKKRPMEFSTVYGKIETPVDCHVLEYILFRRRDPQIDLALAEHARSKTVLLRIYQNGEDSIRVVACGNPSLFDGDGIWDLFDDDEIIFEWCMPESIPSPLNQPYSMWDKRTFGPHSIVENGLLAELRAVCENEYVYPHRLTGLVWRTGFVDDDEKGKPDDALPESRSLDVIRFLSNNPQFGKTREESREGGYWDGYSEYRYRNMFDVLWTLPANVPTTAEWAKVLSSFLSNLQPPSRGTTFRKGLGLLGSGKKQERNLDQLLERWRIPVGEFEPDYYAAVRTEIVKKNREPSLEMLSDDDYAVRQAFYSTFDPEKPEFKFLNWSEWDNYAYHYLLKNENIWRSPAGRSELSSLANLTAGPATILYG